MNDEFLHRLRTQPSRQFAAGLKLRLDLQAARAEFRKRALYILSALLIGGAAFAFIAPRARNFATSFSGRDTAVRVASARSDVRAATPLRSSGLALHDSSDNQRTPRPPALETDRQSGTARSAVAAVDPDDIATQTHTGAGDIPLGDSRAPASPTNGAAVQSTIADIRIAGSHSVVSILELAIKEFRTKTDIRTRFSLDIAGAGGGFKRFCDRRLDIAIAARPILKVEMDTCAASEIKYVELPIAYEALAVVVNPTATWAERMTIDELRAMWNPAAQGIVNKWNGIRIGWPDRPLKLFGPDRESAAFGYFTELVNGKPRSSRGDFTASENEDVSVQRVVLDPDALGIVSYGYYADNSQRLKSLKIVNASGQLFTASEAAILSGAYNPLSRPLFIYVNEANARQFVVKEFVTFVLSNGATFAKRAHHVPLDNDTYRNALKRFRDNKLGTVFGGLPQIDMDVEAALERDGEL